MKLMKASTFNLLVNLNPHLGDIHDNIELFEFILLMTIKSIVIDKPIMVHQDDLMMELKEHGIGTCQCVTGGKLCSECLSNSYLDRYLLLVTELIYKEATLSDQDKNNLIHCVDYDDFIDNSVVRYYGTALIGVELYERYV